MATDPSKMPPKWDTLDPGEQWEASLAAAKAIENAERGAWQQRTREALRKELDAKARKEYDRWELAWHWIAGIAGGLAVLALIGFWSWTAWEGHQRDVQRDDDYAIWVQSCVGNGGRVVREASGATATGPRMCVKTVDVVSTHE